MIVTKYGNTESEETVVCDVTQPIQSNLNTMSCMTGNQDINVKNEGK
jgi:hypothetical protein